MKELIFDIRWSLDITPAFIEDFIFVLESVWKKKFVRDIFQCRYLNNIYGPSLLVLAYVDGVPSGTQAFWRNDISKRVAYQADDGAVIESCRGNGLLGKMIQKGTEILGDDALMYSYTNSKSKKSFLKLGWDVMLSYPIRPLICNKNYIHQCPLMIDYEYAEWFLCKREHISYVKRNNCYYLIIPTSYRYIFQVITRCDQNTAMLFHKKKGFAMLVFNKQPNNIDNEKNGNVVVQGHRGEIIPIWKCDAI